VYEKGDKEKTNFQRKLLVRIYKKFQFFGVFSLPRGGSSAADIFLDMLIVFSSTLVDNGEL
jgi:hypothetical protein